MTITDEDREAAADYWLSQGIGGKDTLTLYMNGLADESELVRVLARHRILGRKEGLEAAAEVARDCAIFDSNDKLLNSDIRKTCADAIRNIDPETLEVSHD